MVGVQQSINASMLLEIHASASLLFVPPPPAIKRFQRTLRRRMAEGELDTRPFEYTVLTPDTVTQQRLHERPPDGRVTYLMLVAGGLEDVATGYINAEMDKYRPCVGTVLREREKGYAGGHAGVGKVVVQVDDSHDARAALHDCPCIMGLFAFLGVQAIPVALSAVEQPDKDAISGPIESFLQKTDLWDQALHLWRHHMRIEQQRFVDGSMWNGEVISKEQISAKDWTEKLGAVPFRASCLRDGHHGDVKSQDIMVAMGEGVTGRHSGWRVKLTGYDMEVMAIVFHSSLAYGIHLNVRNNRRTQDVPSQDRQHLVSGLDRRIRLRPSTAHLMLRMADVHKMPAGSVVLDPMAGIGTIPLEAARHYPVRGMAVDTDEPVVDNAQDNVRHATRNNLMKGTVEARVGDAGQLDGIQDESVDAIVTDMPFNNVCRMNLSLLRRTLQEIARLLKDHAPAVLLSRAGDIIVDNVQQDTGAGVWHICGRHAVNIGGLEATVVVLRRQPR